MRKAIQRKPIQAGQSFSLANDKEILEINSPTACVCGPYAVVHKDFDERWVIVAMGWSSNRQVQSALGIRWFHGKAGNPLSRRYPTWFVVPNELAPAILGGLPLSPKFSRLINKFLLSKLPNDELTKELTK